MHVYLRSQPRGDVVVFRGFMFAESVERDWYSLLVSFIISFHFKSLLSRVTPPGSAAKPYLGSRALSICFGRARDTTGLDS